MPFILVESTLPGSPREFLMGVLLRRGAKFGLAEQRSHLIRAVDELEGVTGCVMLDDRPSTIESIARLAQRREVKVVALTTADLLGIPAMQNLLVIRLHKLGGQIDEVMKFLGVSAQLQ